MVTILVVLMCAVSQGFLLYLLVNWGRELRKIRMVRAAVAMAPFARATAAAADEDRESRKVIEISTVRRVNSPAGRRRAS
jgi:hypothetical protein